MSRLSMQGLRRKFERKMRHSAANSGLTAYGAPSGTLARTTYATYTLPDISATYVEAEVQAIADHVLKLSQRLAAVITDLQTRGILS